MKMLAVRCLVALGLLAAVTVAFANPFKSKIISSDDSVLEIIVPGDHFMKITNFTQDGGTDRAVVQVCRVIRKMAEPPMFSQRPELILAPALTRRTLPKLIIE
jgi:hypothetical protein